ncbi:hypothetical protein GCK32_018821, partial [Trichostrongylus colubriformis]
MSTSKEVYTYDESKERIKERVRQRDMELSASMEGTKENLESSALSESRGKSTESEERDSVITKDVLMESPLKNKTNSSSAAGDSSFENKKTPTARLKSRFSELAAEYENFEVDHNWQQAGSKPKEAYMKGVSPRLSIGE